MVRMYKYESKQRQLRLDVGSLSTPFKHTQMKGPTPVWSECRRGLVFANRLPVAINDNGLLCWKWNPRFAREIGADENLFLLLIGDGSEKKVTDTSALLHKPTASLQHRPKLS